MLGFKLSMQHLRRVVTPGMYSSENAFRSFQIVRHMVAVKEPGHRADKLRSEGVDVETEYQKEIEDIMHKADEKKKRRQSLVGIVVSTKCAKSVVVEVYRDKVMRKYHKVFRIKKKFMAHDEEQKGVVGDIVRIVPSRAHSRRKRHVLFEILQKANDMANITSTHADMLRSNRAARMARPSYASQEVTSDSANASASSA